MLTIIGTPILIILVVLGLLVFAHDVLVYLSDVLHVTSSGGLRRCTSRGCWRNKGSNWSKCIGCEIEIEFQKIRAVLKNKKR